MKISNKEILRVLRSRKIKADERFLTIYRMFEPQIENQASKYSSLRFYSTDDAKSCIMEALLKAIRKYDRKRGSSFKTFFWKISQRLLINLEIAEGSKPFKKKKKKKLEKYNDRRMQRNAVPIDKVAHRLVDPINYEERVFHTFDRIRCYRREGKVFRRIEKGYNNSEIRRDLRISVWELKKSLNKIRKKSLMFAVA